MAPHRGRPAGSGVVWPSAKTVYAFRACQPLVAAYPAQLLKASDIAAETGVPLRFLSKILGEMREAGLVTSRRGYRGGYQFLRSPAEVTVAELMVAVGGYELFAPVPADGPQPGPLIERLQRKLRDVAGETLTSISIADIASTSGGAGTDGAADSAPSGSNASYADGIHDADSSRGVN
jgi:Rrf2 family protein